MVKMISVSDELKIELDTQKKDEGHTSYDSLIRAYKYEARTYKIENELLRKKLEEFEKKEE